ncbi:MAG: DUF882 domain-containing protein [Deltaproteobacteria bacterium]|nr:DUF882 domain-containing protein [Deltaproteobacteria bacterium]
MRLTGLLVILLFAPPVYGAPGRFFYEGNGFLSIANENTKSRASVHYRLEDGSYDRGALNRLNSVFGMPEKMGEDISLRLISMLDYLEDKFAKGKTLALLSGYRSVDKNRRLRRAAKASQHIDGMAADVIFPGVPPKKVWEHLRTLDCCGAGYYGGKAVHVDSGRPRFWTGVSPRRPKGADENKYIYLSIDKDIYFPGETIRLFLSGVSHFPFGIRPELRLMHKKRTILTLAPDFKQRNHPTCQPIRQRAETRFIYWKIPEKMKFPKGTLNFEMNFCDAERWVAMPKELISKPFKIQTN